MCRKAQFMPQAIHESLSFNSRKRKVAIHCVFSLKGTRINNAFFVGRELVLMINTIFRLEEKAVEGRRINVSMMERNRGDGAVEIGGVVIYAVG